MKLDKATALACDVNAIRQFFKDRNLLCDATPCSEVGYDYTLMEVKDDRKADSILW